MNKFFVLIFSLALLTAHSAEASDVTFSGRHAERIFAIVESKGKVQSDDYFTSYRISTNLNERGPSFGLIECNLSKINSKIAQKAKHVFCRIYSDLLQVSVSSDRLDIVVRGGAARLLYEAMSTPAIRIDDKFGGTYNKTIASGFEDTFDCAKSNIAGKGNNQDFNYTCSISGRHEIVQ